MDRNINLLHMYLVMYEKHHLLQVYVCNTVIVAKIKNKLVWLK